MGAREWILFGADLFIVALGFFWLIEKVREKWRGKPAKHAGRGRQQLWVLTALGLILLGAIGVKVEYFVWRGNRVNRVTMLVREELERGKDLRGDLLKSCSFNAVTARSVEDFHGRILKGLVGEGTDLDVMFAGEPSDSVMSPCPERDAAVRRVEWHIARLREVLVGLPSHLR